MRVHGIPILLSLLALSEAASIEVRQNRNGNNKGGNANANNGAAANQGANAAANGGANPTCLSANAVATGSALDGNDVPADGQAASATDKANFINFCAGQTLTNGLQTKTGSCNGIVMGKIPATTKMISSIIVSPSPGQDVKASTSFDIKVQTQGLSAGSFTNAQSTYYSAPQDLDGSGQIIGHTHVTVQDLGNSLAPSTPPDPTQFAFFKGINDAGNGKGLLSATVTGGLPAGNYRICTMTSSSNHQPVLMPVAQRGSQDDCQKITVTAAGGGGGGNNANANAGNAANTGNGGKGGNAAANAGAANANAGTANANAGNTGKGGNAAASAGAAKASAGAANANAGAAGGFGGFGGGAGGRGGRARRHFSSLDMVL